MAIEVIENNAQPKQQPKQQQHDQTTGDTFSIFEMLRMMRAKVLWILLSIFVCTAVAYYIYKREPAQYGCSAEVMLLFGNDESSAASNAMKALSDLNGTTTGQSVNFYNELEIMRSPSLMESVVERLNLATTYSTEGFGHAIDLYGYSPVLVNFIDVAADSTASLTLTKAQNGELIATNFIANGKAKASKPLRITPGTVVETPVGALAISATADYERFPEFVEVRKQSVKAIAKNFSSRVVTTRKANDNSVAVIDITDESQQRAIDVVNGLIEAYNALWVTEQTRNATNTSRFINDRLAVIEKELSGIDSDISQVKSASQAADPAAAISTYFGQSMNYDTQAYEATTKLSIAEYLRDYLNDPANANSMIPSNTGTSGAIESQIQEYNKMLVKRDQLLQNGTEANPVIAQMNSDLASNRALILASLNNTISNFRIEINRAQGRGADFSGKVSAVPEQEKQILSIERQQKVKENLYLYLLQKREENELSRLVQVNNTRIIRSAYGTGPTTGTLKKYLLTGFLVGLAIPVLIIFLIIRFDTKVSTKKDLAGLTIPFLGIMPLNPTHRSLKRRLRQLLHPHSRTFLTDDDLKLVVREHSRSYINEAFRMLRTNLDFLSHSESGCEVIMLTSSNPGSGKTFISLNLAKTLALKGKKVLAIDLDMRRASLSTFGGNATQGVSTYLTGTSADILSLISYNNRDMGLDLLPVGAIPPNPAELVLSSRFEDMIATLRQHYDYLVLDCPPYDIVADTAIIARVVDVTLYVIRAGLFNKAMLGDVEELYQQDKLPHMATILNGVNPKSSYYYHRYGYGYGYGGKKGYYFSDDESPKKSKKHKHDADDDELEEGMN